MDKPYDAQARRNGTVDKEEKISSHPNIIIFKDHNSLDNSLNS